jgi:hypothetical protein
MKNIANGSQFTFQVKRIAITFAAIALGFVASEHRAFGQWKQASGFSNSAANNNTDGISGFAVYRSSLLADAKCGIDLLQGPGATPDSFFISTDFGATWFSGGPNGGIPLLAVGNGPIPSAILGGAEPDASHNQVLDEYTSYSSDFGQTWQVDTAGWNVSNSSGIGLQTSSLAAIGTTVYTTTPSGVYEQTVGSAWVADMSGINLGGNLTSIAAVYAAGNTLFISTFYNGVFRSTNQGSNWSAANNGLPSFTSNSIVNLFQTQAFASSGTAVFAAVSHDTNIFGGPNPYSLDIYRSMDNGQSWSKMNSGALEWGSEYGFTASGSSVFMATDSGFFASTNSGATWAAADQGLPPLSIDRPSCVQIAGGNIVIGTGSSNVWYRPLTDFAGSSVAPGTAAISGLNVTVSANPASGSDETVTFTMSDPGVARVQLMDELGREVRMLQNGRASVGENTVTIDPLTLANGTYFVHVEANGMTAMQKLVISR